MVLNESNEDSNASPNVIDFSIITAKKLSGFWVEHLLRVFIFQPTDNRVCSIQNVILQFTLKLKLKSCEK